MRSCSCRIALLLTPLVVGLVSPTSAAEAPPRPQPVREIFVPFEDLNVILESGGQRVFMEREKYESLVQQARRSAEAAPPHPFSMATADYGITVEDGRAIIRGRLVIDVAAKGIHAIDLEISGVGLRSATLDGQPAAIAQATPATKPTLFVTGEGQHTFELEMVTPLEVAAARQTLRFRLPRANTGRMRVVVPGNVDIRSGATVLARTVDEESEVTRFELLPTTDETTLVMSLNNRTAQLQQIVTASNVYVAELTAAYERLHVTNSMKVLHGSVDQFRIAVPANYEVIDVSTPLLSRWEVSGDGDQRILTVRLREPISDMAILNIAAERGKPALENWQLPRLQPLDVASSASIVGVLVESRLETLALATDGLLPIDTRVLTETLPASIFTAEPGAPEIQPIAAFYAPQADYRVTGSFAKPTGRVQVVSNTVLTLLDSGLEVRGGFALLPIAERIFGCDFTTPPGWKVTEVSYGNGQQLEFEVYENEDGSTRVRIRLPQAIQPGDGYGVYFRATHTPEGWLAAWDSQSIEFPQFAVLEASSDRGAIAVVTGDDLGVTAGETTGLVPLDNSRKTEFSLESVATDLALEYAARPYSATLNVTRKSSRITAETYSFFRLSPGRLNSHYEIVYDIREARARQLSFRLPAETPEEISISGVDGAAVKEFNSQVDGEERVWTVELAQPILGLAHVAISFEQPLAAPGNDAQTGTIDLPMIVADGVEYQTGVISVEGSAELEINLETDARRVDAGELIGARYQPGRRLLAAFGFVGQPAAITASYSRPVQHGLPSAIVQRAELVTVISSNGVSQSTARFLLRTKASFIEVRLPMISTLWSVYLDGMAAKPQRDGEQLLISVPASNQQLRNLQLVYETNRGKMGLSAKYRAQAPQLFLRSQAAGTPAVPLPTADLEWYVHLPAGYRLAASHGTVHPNLSHQETIQQIAGYETPAIRTVEGLATQTSAGLLLHSGPQAAREAARYGRIMTAEQGALADSATASGSESAASAPVDPRGYALRESAPEDRPGQDATPDDAESDVTSVDESREEEAAGFPSGTAGRQLGDKRYWALEGLRSLRIDLTAGERPVLFQSLGEQPELNVRLVHQPRIELLALAASLLVLVLGLLLLARTWRSKLTYVGSVLILTSLVPLLTGLDRELGAVFDWCFFAGLILLPIYLLVNIVRCLASYVHHVPGKAVASLLLLAVLMAGSPSAGADETTAELGPLEVKLLEGLPPVEVPADAVIVPFELNGPLPTTSARVIVPLATYERLRKLAFPDADLETTPPPAPYALAGASWRTKLLDGNHLEVQGSLTVDVLSENTVTVMLPFDGGVLRAARLNDKPARVQIIQAPPLEQQRRGQPQDSANQQAPVQQAIAAPAPAMIAVYIKGSGRHELTLTTQYPLTRQGGWRIAHGNLPAAFATSLRVTVPNQDTQLRVIGLADRTSYDTDDDDQQIETALAADGRFHLQWRPRVSESTVDRSLTVTSEAVFDVQEDRLRLMWQLQLKFPRSQRDAFTLRVPNDYLVEGVDGENIRNWQNKAGELQVELLKPARDSQQLTLRLAAASPVRDGQTAEIDVPVVDVQDAALHEGRIAIRRGPLIELQTAAASNVIRTDWASVTSANQAAVISPLGIRAFQAYEFNRAPFKLALAATPLPTRTRASLQTVLRIGQGERTAETRVNLQSNGQPIYRVTVDLPVDCEVTDVSGPEPFQWSTTGDDSGPQLRIFFGSGQSGDLSVILQSRLGERGSVASVAVPRFLVQNVERQETSIVVQTDPSYAVTAENLVNCAVGLLSETHAWLAESQRVLARLALRSEQTDFTGDLRLTRRTPRVTCQTVSNLRVTERAFEETVLLNYAILDAGIREVAFLLPIDMRDARVNTQLLQSKVVEDVADNSNLVRFRLTLQDEVIGELRVLVEQDRLLTTNQRSVPIPRVENARAGQQFVAIESAGRDEVVINTQQQLEPLSRQQSSWRTLSAILGDSITQAFLVQSSAENPQLVVSTQDRQAVETVTARIAYAQSVLVMDANGAYRAIQRYYVNNRTEQFLTIQLPFGASLWTAVVAGEPVKPISTSQADQVRIPLVKTAEGENDYVVELKYGGGTGRLGRLSHVDFPLLKTLNIKAEASQVTLRLPESHRWFWFGGTMRNVDSEGDLIAGYLQYQTDQITNFTKGLNSSNPYARARSVNNIRQLAQAASGVQRQASQLGWQSDELRRTVEANRQAIEAAQKELQRLESAQQREQVGFDNRGNLNSYFKAQSNTIAKDLVNEQASNFDIPAYAQDADQNSNDKQPRGQIAEEWLDSNRLRSDARVLKEAEDAELSAGRVQIDGRQKKGRGKSDYQFDLFDAEATQQNTLATPELPPQPQRDGERKIRRFEEQLEQQQRQAEHGPQTFSRLAVPPGDPVIANQAESSVPILGDAPSEPDGNEGIMMGQLGGGGFAGQAAGLGPANYEPLGFASLDVAFPQRGREVRFTTPRGDIEISARAVSETLWFRLSRLLVVVAMIAAALVGLYFFRFLASHFRAGPWSGSLLVLGGMIVGLLGYGVLCVALILLGLIVLVRWRWSRTFVAAPMA